MSLQPDDDARSLIRAIGRTKPAPDTRPRVSQADIARAETQQLYGAIVFGIGILCLFWSIPLGIGLIIVGGFVFDRSMTKESKLRGAINHQRVLDTQERVYGGMGSMYNREPSPEVESIRALKEIELAKINNAHQAREGDATRKANETIVRLNNQTQVDLAKLNFNAQIEVAKIQGFTSREVARFQALGQAGDFARQKEMIELHHGNDMKKLSAGHAHTASEAEKDRQATIEQMITRFEGKIKEIETRMEYENPNAHKRSQEELITLRGRMAQMREINKISDPVERKQMYDQFKKGWA